MSEFVKKVRFRWDDVDANRHVASSSYLKVTVDQRMHLLRSRGFDHEYFAENQLGPVVLREELHYLSEVSPDEQLYVKMEIEGLTEDYKFFKFSHRIYGSDGDIVFYTSTIISLLNLELRKLIVPPDGFMDFLDEIPEADNYATLEKADLRLEHVPYEDSIDIDNLNL